MPEDPTWRVVVASLGGSTVKHVRASLPTVHLTGDDSTLVAYAASNGDAIEVATQLTALLGPNDKCVLERWDGPSGTWQPQDMPALNDQPGPKGKPASDSPVGTVGEARKTLIARVIEAVMRAPYP